jgi:FlaA1/EpsC-like NDP-sugar epimerase
MKFAATRIGGLAVDAAVLGSAYLGSFFLRFDFTEPRWGWRAVAMSFVTVCAASLLSLLACGCYRFSWRHFRLREVPRFLFASMLACAALTGLRFFTPFESSLAFRPPYTIILIYSLLSLFGVVGWRSLWSWYARTLVRESDLLERRIRRMDSSAAVGFLGGKTVMVTGAGGSIGSELVRQVAISSPRLVLMVERSENALYEIDREMRQKGTGADLKPLMVDVNDEARMRELFALYRPDIVLHAAAYKHVPMVEMNPQEGERNNTGATKKLAALSSEFGVSRFVLISTDKAVNPVSVMGKTKRAAELAIMAMNAGNSPTSFCAVRFGNVLGSSGSVVPLFREQIQKRLPLTVTHPEMRRYFMTVTEAVGLVLQAASRKEKAIYTLDMGKSVYILDLAEEMIRQAGYRPYVDIPIVFTGIRPGEKLFEELDISEKSAYRTDMARIYITKT